MRSLRGAAPTETFGAIPADLVEEFFTRVAKIIPRLGWIWDQFKLRRGCGDVYISPDHAELHIGSILRRAMSAGGQLRFLILKDVFHDPPMLNFHFLQGFFVYLQHVDRLLN